MRLLRCGALATALAVALAATPALAEAPPERSGAAEAGRVAFDLVILRPLGLFHTAFGASAFVIAYPVSLVTGGSEDVVHLCITYPIDQTFRRPLGEL